MNLVIELDSLLNLPTKLIPLVTEFNGKRYFLIEGGRGGGKSHAVGRFILYLAEIHSNLRIVCGREIQNSIKESVYSLLTDLVQEFNLNFIVQSKTIIHRETGSEINFRGFREQGSFNIQGMEKVDIVWIDEAQALQKETLDKLIPTIIRNEKSKIIFTMNRFVRNDPAYARFVDDAECLHLKLNYTDNPFCANALKVEAEKCRKRSEDDFNHIWLGMPLDKTEDSVFTHSELDSAKKNRYPLRAGYDFRIGGFDIARFGDDKCACVILQQMGALHWEVVHVEQWDHKDVVYSTGRINQIVSQYNVNRAIVDADGLGGPYYDLLVKGREKVYSPFNNIVLGYDKNRNYGNPRTANTYKLKDMFLSNQICIKDEEVLNELETLRYEYDHNQRRILLSKDKMRKEGVKSPNLADALIMAVSLIGEVLEQQETQYQPRQTRANENLFEIAGVR